MGQFSITHLLVLAVILLLFFGPSRLPQLGQSIGKAIRGFKQGLNEIDTDAKDVSEVPPQQIPQGQPNAQHTNTTAAPHAQPMTSHPNKRTDTDT
ncbi:MAG: twin-arginine translocase TatA/TatE family subunit [Bdellovibrionota bacterium]